MFCLGVILIIQLPEISIDECLIIFLFDKAVNGVSIPEEEKEGYAWLQEREKPEDLTFVGELYGGPAIVEK